MKNLFIASQFEADFFLDDFKQIADNIYEKDCRVIVTGIGLVNTAISCSSFFSDYGINEEDQYINLGIAGAVNEIYEIGQVIEADSFSTFNIQEVPNTSRGILDEAYPEIGSGDIKIASSQVPVWGEKSINKLKDLKIDLVDMEAYSFVKTCVKFDAPYKVIKAVSDHLIKNSQESFLKNAKIALGNLRKEI